MNCERCGKEIKTCRSFYRKYDCDEGEYYLKNERDYECICGSCWGDLVNRQNDEIGRAHRRWKGRVTRGKFYINGRYV